MSEAEALLSSLRDIQEPLAPTGVSLWLLAANLVALVLLIWALWVRRFRRREGWRIEAKLRIAQARHMKPDDGVLQLAQLLRQIMMHRQENVVDLDGRAWLETLDAHFSTDWFSAREGRVFGHALYQPHTLQPSEFTQLCDNLLRLLATLPACTPTTQYR